MLLILTIWFPLTMRDSLRPRATTRGAICDLRPQPSPQDSHRDHTLATDGATKPARLFCLYFLCDGGFGCRKAHAVRGVADAPFAKIAGPDGGRACRQRRPPKRRCAAGPGGKAIVRRRN